MKVHKLAKYILFSFMILGMLIIPFKSIHASSNKPVYVSMAKHMRYVSQGKSQACEAGALMMALSIKGHARHISLYKFTKNRIGWYNHTYNEQYDANFRYDKNPFTSSWAFVYSHALKKASQRSGAKARIIDGANKRQIVNYLLHHEPIVVEASHRLELYKANGKPSDHIITLIGYYKNKHGREYVQYADSHYNNRHQGIRWGTMKQFLRSYDRVNITGKRGLVVIK